MLCAGGVTGTREAAGSVGDAGASRCGGEPAARRVQLWGEGGATRRSRDRPGIRPQLVAHTVPARRAGHAAPDGPQEKPAADEGAPLAASGSDLRRERETMAACEHVLQWTDDGRLWVTIVQVERGTDERLSQGKKGGDRL